jgi:hypothetical protein
VRSEVSCDQAAQTWNESGTPPAGVHRLSNAGRAAEDGVPVSRRQLAENRRYRRPHPRAGPVNILDVRSGDRTYVTSLEPHILLEALNFIVDFHRDDTVLEFLQGLQALLDNLGPARIRKNW